MGRGRHQAPAGRDDAAVTLEEALDEVDAAPTLFWGGRLHGVARRFARRSSARWITSEVVPSVDGLAHEVTLAPQAGDEQRIASMLPRSRDELAWRLQTAAHILPPGSDFWLAGHAREGIKSAVKALEAHIGAVTTVRTKRRCRVLVARLEREGAPAPDWEKHERRFVSPVADGASLELATLPGTFAHGRLDQGAQTMLGVLEGVEHASRVLDLGAGSGVLGGALALRFPSAKIELVDHSAAACGSIERMIALNDLSPARLGVHLATVGDAPRGPFDLVVTNPPFHEGRHQNRTLVDDFADSARARLTPEGTLLLVANRHLGYAEALRARFRQVDVAYEDTRFRVWRAQGVR